MKLFSFLTAALFCLMTPGVVRAGNGTSAGDFLRMGGSARAAGLADAFAATSDETAGMLYNPAGLGFMFSPEAQATTSLWPGDLRYHFLGYCHPRPEGAAGIGIQYFSGPEIPRVSGGVTRGDFSYGDLAANLAYAARVRENLAAGVTLRALRSVIDDSTLSAMTGDAGLLYTTMDQGFSLGVSGQNLFGSLGGDALPSGWRAGMAFKSSVQAYYSDFILALEAGRAAGSPAYYAAGIEQWTGNVLGLRAGYKHYTDERQRESLGSLAPWRFGFGLRVESMALDYAYQPFTLLGETHFLSLTWRVFGWKIRWRVVPAAVKADPPLFSPNNDGAKDSVFFFPSVPDIRDVKKWELVVTDIAQKPVYEYTDRNVIPKVVSWNGQAASGEMLPEGRYSCHITAEGDIHKMARSAPAELIVDVTPPDASLLPSTTWFSPVAGGLPDGATMYVAISDLNGVDRWQLSVFGAKNAGAKPFKVFTSTAAAATLAWDGRDDFYGEVVPGGEYEAVLEAFDRAGNRSRIVRPLTVLLPERTIVREVVHEITREIEVREESRGLVVTLSSQVLFDAGRADIKKGSIKPLDEVVKLLEAYPENNVRIEGYSDSSGGKEKNIEISSARAWAVYSYLVKHGVSPARLDPRGYGPEKPVAGNDTQEGRAQNRRVEIIIEKKEQ